MTQKPSEDTCQSTLEIVSSPTSNIEQLLTESSMVVTAASEIDKASEQVSLDQNVSDSLDKSVPTTQSINNSQTNLQESLTESQVSLEVEQTDEKSKTSSNPAAITSSDLPTTELGKPLATQEVKTQIVSEATTECPVPIQVAESVLQIEPKETVSENPKPVIEAVASTIIPSVQETTASISEALIQPEGSVPLDQIAPTRQLNGNDPFLQSEAEQLQSSSAIIDARGTSGPDNLSVDQVCTPIEPQSSQPITQHAQLEPPSQLEAIEVDETKLESVIQDEEEISLQKFKLTVQLPQSLLETSEDIAQTQTSITEQEKIVESEVPLEISADSLVTSDAEPPVRPSRTKDLKIPGTPIVISPTPPTSPPLESHSTRVAQGDVQKQLPTEIELSAQSESQIEKSTVKLVEVTSETPQLKSSDIPAESLADPLVQSQPEQVAETERELKKSKKITKKSSAESDTPSSPESEGSGKKIVKKVVKKVTKKSKESAEGEGEGGSSEKPKKTTKKVTKISSKSLETDTTVLETPPPSASSEPPVPPKRKSKSTKSTDKKPDES